MDKCTQCNMNYESKCDLYGEMDCSDAIMICETNEFLMYPPNEEENTEDDE